MSTRNIRKLQALKANDKPVQDDTDENTFEPAYTGKSASFAGLIEGFSDEDSGTNNENKSSGEEGATASAAPEPKKKNKNNRKKRNKNKHPQAGPSGINCNTQEPVDEIANIVEEVNRLLGEPVIPEKKPELPKQKNEFLKIDYKNLNAENELTRLFGSDVEDEGRRARQRPNLRHMRRQIISPPEKFNFTIKGLSMKLMNTKNGIKYFRFEHSTEYQHNLDNLVQALKHFYSNHTPAYDRKVWPSDTVEGVLENLDLYFQVEETSLAVKCLEQVIYFMQCAFDTQFNLVDGVTRLEYEYVENRPFHIAILKYAHILSNKACHRTALELIKLLVKLDPCDPLGVIFIMDTFAIRAREFDWIINFYGAWGIDEDCTRLFHIQYSLALARFNLYLKSRDTDDLNRANYAIRHALMMYPNVAVILMKSCNHNNAVIMNHEMFTTFTNNTTSQDLLNLQTLYVAFLWAKWREPEVMDWLTDNCLEIKSLYDNNPSTKTCVEKVAAERAVLFRKFPLEIDRYLHTISAMSNLLVDGAVPTVKSSMAFNPYPYKGKRVDLYNYYEMWSVPTRRVIEEFFGSMIPGRAPLPDGNQPDNGEE